MDHLAKKTFDPFSPRVTHDRRKANAMNEFKFACPHCNQHIQAAEDLIGRQFECPGFHHLIRVPPAPGKEDQSPTVESGRTWDTFVAPRILK
jgi:hypothetical protein